MNAEDLYEANLIAEQFYLTDELVREMVQESIKDAYLSEMSLMHGGASVYLDDEAVEIWDEVGRIVFTNWMSTRGGAS